MHTILISNKSPLKQVTKSVTLISAKRIQEIYYSFVVAPHTYENFFCYSGHPVSAVQGRWKTGFTTKDKCMKSTKDRKKGE